MMKNSIYTLATLAMLAMTACGGGGDSCSKYVLDGNEEAAQYFDQVLADSLRAASPQLAAEIFGPAK